MIINPRKRIEKMKTAGDRIADVITDFSGSLTFVVLHAIWFTAWILINLGLFGRQLQFDPYPFGLLTLIVSLEAIFLSTFVMISQNRQAEEADIRSQLDYQTDLLAEREISIMMEALVRIAEKHEVEVGDLVERLKTAQNAPELPELPAK